MDTAHRELSLKIVKQWKKKSQGDNILGNPQNYYYTKC